MRQFTPTDRALIASYVLAIVAANLVVTRYGQIALPFTAFVLIPFDLVTRDILHERWEGRMLLVRMAALIAAGSVLAAALNANAVRVAVASFCGFAAAQSVNAALFHVLRSRVTRYVRMNASNVCAALADSIVFPVIAFGAGTSVALVGAQWASKVIGGLVISAVAIRYLRYEVHHG